MFAKRGQRNKYITPEAEGAFQDSSLKNPFCFYSDESGSKPLKGILPDFHFVICHLLFRILYSGSCTSSTNFTSSSTLFCLWSKKPLIACYSHFSQNNWSHYHQGRGRSIKIQPCPDIALATPMFTLFFPIHFWDGGTPPALVILLFCVIWMRIHTKHSLKLYGLVFWSHSF